MTFCLKSPTTRHVPVPTFVERKSDGMPIRDGYHCAHCKAIMLEGEPVTRPVRYSPIPRFLAAA